MAARADALPPRGSLSRALGAALLLVGSALGPAACGSTEARPADVAAAPGGDDEAAASAAQESEAAGDLALVAPTAAVAPDQAAPAAVDEAREAPEPAPAWPAWWPACARQSACDHGLDAWLEARGGWVNRLLVAGPLPRRVHKRRTDPRELAAALADTEQRVLVTRDPVLELAPHGRLPRDADAPVWLLRARVFSNADRDVDLRGGGLGRLTVTVGDHLVVDTTSGERLLPDAHRYPTRLRRGWNDLLVRLEQVSPYAAQLTLRLRARDGGRIEGLAWDLPADAADALAAPSLCDALGASLRAEITPAGWRAVAHVGAIGLVPAPRELPLTLAVAHTGDDRADAPLAQAALEVAALADAPLAPADAPAEPALIADLPASPSDPIVTLALAGEPCARLTVHTRPDLVARLLAADAALAALPATTPSGTRDSLAFLAERARDRLEGQSPHAARVADDLDTLERLLPIAARGDDPYADLTGVVVRAYRSPLDGTLQRYVLLVPASYPRRADAAFPLVVASHGLHYTPEDMARIVTGRPTRPGATLARGAPDAFDLPADLDALVVAHDGYGNAGHRAPGEADLLRVVEEVRAAYRVDPRRVSLTGFSLGGSVAFWTPLRHPDRFAAAAPLCGYPNLTEYRTIRSARKRTWERHLLESEGVVEYADNGRYLPLRIVHGGRDRPERSEVVVDRYRDLRYPVDFEVPEDAGHNVWDDAYADGSLLAWLTRARRPAVPAHPRLRTARYRFSKSAWLRLDRLARHDAFGSLAGDLSKRRLAVTTDNVAAFSLLASDLGAAEDTPPRAVVVDGQKLGDHSLRDDLHLSRDPETDRWRLTDFPDVPDGHKRAQVEGPLRDVFFDPFVVVYGTADPVEAEANLLTAEAVRSFSPWITARAPILRDVDATAADLRGRHVVLVGGPRSNLHTRAIADSLPVRFEDDALVFDGVRYEGADVGISTILPSPFDPGHALVLHAGVGAEGTLSARYLPELAPDWLIYDSRLRATWGDYVLGRRDVLAGGLYDGMWRP